MEKRIKLGCRIVKDEILGRKKSLQKIWLCQKIVVPLQLKAKMEEFRYSSNSAIKLA
jgi:hypothetical protein